MNLASVGEVIATRKLYLVHDKESVKEILIFLGKPQPFQNSSDFYCPYQITGIGDEKVRYAGGVDEIQAIQLVLKMIGAELYTSEEAKFDKLRWLDKTDGDLGFPMPTK